MNDVAERLLREGIDRGAFPGAQACAIRDGQVLFDVAAGARNLAGAPVDPHTRFDVASLTKVMATTSAAWVLLSGGALRLDDPVSRWFPAFADGGAKSRVTVRHLLAHTSGLPAWRPLFAPLVRDPALAALYPGGGGPEPAVLAPDVRDTARRKRFAAAREVVVHGAATALLDTEPGRACVYSDLGFILLGEIVAAYAGMTLDAFARQWIFGPLGLAATGYRPLPARADEGPFACTGRTRPREPAKGQEGLYDIPPQRPHDDPGEVDDDNCWAMGGVSGHAGLFSTARDVAAWGDAVRGDRDGAGRIGDARTLDELLALDPHPEGPPRALGFDVPSGPRSSAGTRIGHAGERGARGHLAFTGCSVWIDFDRRLTVALLTNRVYPSRGNEAGIRDFRPAFHDAVIEALEGR